MSFGVPVIARNIPGNRFITHDKTGFLFDTENEFSILMNILLRNKDKWCEISTNSHQYIQSQHNEKEEHDFYRRSVSNKVIPS